MPEVGLREAATPLLSSRLETVQLPRRGGLIDLGPGTATPAAFPSAELEDAAAVALREVPFEALTYGANHGPGALREWLAEWLPSLHGGAIAPRHVVVTGGIAAALDRLCSLLTAPGDVVLVQAPTYHLALELFACRRLRVVPVPDGGDGPDPAAVEHALSRVPEEQRRVLYYAVPTHANPTGRTVRPERRRALVELARARGLVIVEDEAYSALRYDDAEPSPPAYDPEEEPHVARLGSVSKILAPGLRVGWMVAGTDLVEALANDGASRSGGGPNHWAAMVVTALFKGGSFPAHFDALLRHYRDRRDAMLEALDQHLAGLCSWHVPSGGFFVWLRSETGVDTTRALAAAERLGVSYTPGSAFFPEGPASAPAARQALRLSFSSVSPAEMHDGVSRLARALGDTAA